MRAYLAVYALTAAAIALFYALVDWLDRRTQNVNDPRFFEKRANT